MRYLVADSENFEGGRYRFVYDTKYKTFSIVQQRLYVSNAQPSWKNVKRAPDNFYVYFPGFAARTLRQTDVLPNWK